jgi:hypothetical protein
MPHTFIVSSSKISPDRRISELSIHATEPALFNAGKKPNLARDLTTATNIMPKQEAQREFCVSITRRSQIPIICLFLSVLLNFLLVFCPGCLRSLILRSVGHIEGQSEAAPCTLGHSFSSNSPKTKQERNVESTMQENGKDHLRYVKIDPLRTEVNHECGQGSKLRPHTEAHHFLGPPGVLILERLDPGRQKVGSRHASDWNQRLFLELCKQFARAIRGET